MKLTLKHIIYKHIVLPFCKRYYKLHPIVNKNNSLLTIWDSCELFKSPDTEELKMLWSYYKNRPIECKFIVYILTLKLMMLDVEIEGSDFSEYLLLLELLLICGNYDRCIELSESFVIEHSQDLRLQDIRARAFLFRKDDSPLKNNIDYGTKPFAKYFCPNPFQVIAIFEQDVFVCCCNYLPTSIGSISSDSFEKLWDSPIAQNIRLAVLDGSFRYCNKMVCPALRAGDLKLRADASIPKRNKLIISENITTSPGCYPICIELNDDPTCNLSCPSCRASSISGDAKLLKNVEENILPEMLKHNIWSFLIAGYGEPFASNHYLRILRSLDASKHRIDHLIIFTNAVLFTKERWEELANIHPFKIEVRISIDATTEETYNRLRRGGNWHVLLQNLEFVKTLRQKGCIYRLLLNFVVQYDNFIQLPDFVAFGKKYNADKVGFVELQKFGEYADDDFLYAEKAIHLPSHRDYEKYQSILQNPVFKDPVVSCHGLTH